MYKSVEALPFLSYLAAIITFTAATGLFLVEERSNIPSMPHSLWLAIVTMTTVGYGDFFPTTTEGYVIASFSDLHQHAFLGVTCRNYRPRVHGLLAEPLPSPLDHAAPKESREVGLLFSRCPSHSDSAEALHPFIPYVDYS